MLIDDVQQAMFQAMKARRGDEVAALRLALSALKSAAIDARRDLSDDEAVAVLQREARKRREAEQAYRDAGRPERADREAFERSVLDRFLPSMLQPAQWKWCWVLAGRASSFMKPLAMGSRRTSIERRHQHSPASLARKWRLNSAPWSTTERSHSDGAR